MRLVQVHGRPPLPPDQRPPSGRFSRSAPGYRLDAGAGAHDPAEQAEVALPRLARGARGRDAARGVGKAAERADGAQFIHTHRWRVHDLVMWDNRCTMHRGTEYDERRWKRDMHRATVSDIGNTCEA